MKRITICALGAIGALTLGLGFMGCEEGSGKRGNTVDEKKVVPAPEDNPAFSLEGGKTQ